MTLKLPDIRELVQQITDLEIGNDVQSDITETLVDTFIREGYQRIVSLNTRWPWFQCTWTLPTVVDQREYVNTFTPDISTGGTTPGSTFSDIREIISVVNETDMGNQLIYIDNFAAEKVWNGVNDLPSIPSYFSMWAGTMQLWPTPDDVYTLKIRGFRQPSYAWLSDVSLNVDLNDEFHIMLINFAVARCYQFQEDPELAAVYMNHFDQGVTLARSNITAPNSNQQLVLSGGLRTNYPFNYYGDLALRAVRLGQWV